MMYACPRCGKRTKIPHKPRLDKENGGGLLRKRECTVCPHEFETQENERGVVNRIALREFKREYSALLDELRELLRVVKTNH